MFGNHSCSACKASLQPEDGHDMCPSCLGLEHLREGLSKDPSMNCSIMPRSVRAARLVEVEDLLGHTPSLEQTTPSQVLPPAQSSQAKRWASETGDTPPRRRAKESRLASKVDQLTEELNQMKSLLLAFQPRPGAAEMASCGHAESGRRCTLCGGIGH